MKEVYRLHRQELGSGFDLVLIGRSPLKNINFAQAEYYILKVLRIAGILSKKR